MGGSSSIFVKDKRMRSGLFVLLWAMQGCEWHSWNELRVMAGINGDREVRVKI
jgi:hypothetical protein